MKYGEQDWKVAEVNAVVNMLRSDDLDNDLFVLALLEHIEKHGLTNNQHLMLGEVAIEALKRKLEATRNP